ncbi:hypothetical protein I2W78_19855 [Streptomyces spinoverrucosus]|uniref:hypothetical protein n=1 Tax=Streptomyces spinoverrucosus TaxID=284043 RepID=UPI0018C3EFA2|nr:hypothetical protein [Streptomyces spinoverrucosus]MBG0854039.1 hypothetical protein [Streptomyces spinoverrucosus]
MIKLSKIVRWADVVLDLLGLAFGVMVLILGIETYRNGGSIGWPIAGSAIFLINFWVAARRLARRRKPTPTP